MQNFIIIFVCLAGGFLLKRSHIFKDDTHLWLNRFVIFVSLPAITLLHIPKIEFSPDLWVPASTAWIVFIVASILFIVAGRMMGWSKATVGCLILCCGLFNSSFVGFPVIEALYGSKGLEMAIMVDQPGSFLVLSTLGIGVAVWYGSAQLSPWGLVKKLFSFPPLIAFILALLVRTFELQYPDALTDVLKVLAKSLAPLALLSVGAQFQLKGIADDRSALAGGLIYRLLLSPFIILAIWGLLAGHTGLHLQVSVMEAAMPPMITGAIIAAQYKLNPPLASKLVGYGLIVSILTLGFWQLLVSNFF